MTPLDELLPALAEIIQDLRAELHPFLPILINRDLNGRIRLILDASHQPNPEAPSLPLGPGAADRADGPQQPLAPAQWARPDPGCFLSSADALNLDLAGDQATKAALSRALTELASVPLDQLIGKRLEPEDFGAYLVPDAIRDLLQCMAYPSAFQQRCSQEQWAVLISSWKKDLKFDPTKDGELSAGERLAKGQGGWDKVWQRFADNPNAFPAAGWGEEEDISSLPPRRPRPVERPAK